MSVQTVKFFSYLKELYSIDQKRIILITINLLDLFNICCFYLIMIIFTYAMNKITQ